jgi:HlyD family secretion protein
MTLNIFSTSAKRNGEPAESPRLEAMWGVAVIGLLLVGLLGWAAFTPLDAAVYAPGHVVVSGHRQTLQHREGGVIRHIYVKEGQHVEKGDVLVDLVGSDVAAAYAALSSQVIELRVEEARLQAEDASASQIAWPDGLQTLSDAERAEVRETMAAQRNQLEARAADLAAHKAVLTKRKRELDDQVRGYQEQVASVAAQQKLVADELASMRSLADQGYAPMSQVRNLERAAADLDGRGAQYAAAIAQSGEQIEELQLQIVQLDTDNKEQIAKELRDVRFQLGDLTPRLDDARDQLGRLEMRAPVAGAVVGLSVFTDGGVITPGQKVMDIVPDRSPLVIEAQISPADADGLHVGQTTEVRLGSAFDRTLPIMKGTLTGLSADSLTNDKSGASYYLVEVTVAPDQLQMVKQAKGGDIHMRPGLPAQVLVPLSKRTALQFLLDPLTRTLWRSFRER